MLYPLWLCSFILKYVQVKTNKVEAVLQNKKLLGKKIFKLQAPAQLYTSGCAILTDATTFI